MIVNEQHSLAICRKTPISPNNLTETTKAKAYRHRLRRRIHILERSRDKLQTTQISVEKQFTCLRDLVLEKKHRLYELFALNRLYDEISDIEVNIPLYCLIEITVVSFFRTSLQHC